MLAANLGRLMVLVWLVLAALAGFSMATPASAGKSDNSIRFAYDQAPENVAPFYSTLRITAIIDHHVWDTLIYRDPKTNEYKGQLATAWKWVDDRTLELDLRQGVKFHDGAEFEADDVVYTLNYVSKPENKAVTTQNVDWIARVEKLGKYKVRIIAKAPFPAAIEYLSGPIAIFPHEYFAKVGPQGMNLKPVGSGPYRVTEHALGKWLLMERNLDYFKDSPKPQPRIDKIEFRFIPDGQTRIAELLTGGIDFLMSVAADQAQQLKRVPNLQVVSSETMRYVFLQLNTQEQTPAPQLRDIRVRKAILHAIDREQMAKSIVGEGARVIHTPCFPRQFGCTDVGAPRYAYDPAKARQLLAEAGFSAGFDVDFYAYRERDQTEAIIGYLRAVGIRANLRFMQYPALREALRANKAPVIHQTWGSFSINDVSAAVSVFHKGLPDDVNRDAEVRDLLERGDTSVDSEGRKQAYATALRLIQERAYTVPLYSLPTHYVAIKDLVFTAYPDELPRFWEMTWR
jgi:peptide/nickel transport system substrate-binding protein